MRQRLDEIYAYLRHHYGPLWPHKIRLLLVIGRPADVELLAPGLTTQYWQEDNATMLLWGGEPDGAIDTAWLGALGKLRRRPLDGLVWVTPVFDQPLMLNDANAILSVSLDLMDRVGHGINACYDAVAARLPLFVWSLHTQAQGDDGQPLTPVGCLLPAGCRPEQLDKQLAALTPALIAQGTQQACGHTGHLFLLHLADQLMHRRGMLCEALSVWLNPYRPMPLAGVIFSPPSSSAARSVNHHWALDARWRTLLEALPCLPAGLSARKTGFAWRRWLAAGLAGVMTLWAVGMAMSYVVNRHLVDDARMQARLAASAGEAPSARLASQAGLQSLLDRLDYRRLRGAPWFARFGLSQNDNLLAALWPSYERGALSLFRDAAAKHLEQSLTSVVRLPAGSPQRALLAKTAYNQLKLYLMLATPEYMDAAWFAQELMTVWPQRQGVADGEWQGRGGGLLAFYAAQLPHHPQWRLQADEGLVSQVRTLLVRQIGARNSEMSLYQKMLSQATGQFADMRLMDMTGDTDAARLFSTEKTVPGIYTRQAWEDAVQPAIDKVVGERREEMDWVLSDNKAASLQETSLEGLKARLTARYFAEFSTHWLSFLNSLRLRKTATLSDAIDQLTLMADVRQSPLVALLNTINIQGRTGQTGQALSDSLVKSAKALFNSETRPVIDQQAGARGPLDATFGPLLTLLDGQSAGQGDAQLNLQTFLTRITQVRLRLQQATGGADPQAMTQALAQTVFQGKSVDLSATRDYGSLVAASLGQEWRGFGQTVFVAPMEQSWQKVLGPAAASLNAQWRAAIVEDWGRAFGGRYPFADAGSEASLPLLARYLHADRGRIALFLRTQLNGVLQKEGSRWVPDSVNAQGLIFDPEFLRAMNRLSRLADVVFSHGEARLKFDLRPGTCGGVMETGLVIDGRKLIYMNQMPTWRRFTWPEDSEAPGASLTWTSTRAGMRHYADLPGAWGWIRLLEKADVTPYPGADSSFSLSWRAPDGLTLNYTMRTEAHEGPLALLSLRDFVLPRQIFRVDSAAAKLAGAAWEDL